MEQERSKKPLSQPNHKHAVYIRVLALAVRCGRVVRALPTNFVWSVCVMEIRAPRSSSSSFGRLKPQSSLPLRSEYPIFLGTLSAVIRTSASSPSYEHGTDRSIPSVSRHQNQGCRRGCGDVPLSLSDFGRAFLSLSRSGRPADSSLHLSSRQPLFERPNETLL